MRLENKKMSPHGAAIRPVQEKWTWKEFLQHLKLIYGADIRRVSGDVEGRCEVYCEACLDSIYILPAGVVPPEPSWEDPWADEKEVSSELVADVLRAAEEHLEVHERTEAFAKQQNL